MPSYTIHLAVAAEYLKTHPTEDAAAFCRGVILPDLLEKPASHYGPASSLADPQRYASENGLDTSEKRGYYLHLLTDKLFYQEFLDMSTFSKEIYRDYDRLNKRLIERYALEIPDEIRGVIAFEDGEPRVLSPETLDRFIETAAARMDIMDI